VRIIATADTHGFHDRHDVPDGDVFVHAGDLTQKGGVWEIMSALDWIGDLPHALKIVIAGNHDVLFETDPEYAETLVPEGVVYLNESGFRYRDIFFWGSPWTPRYFNWAFNADRGEDIRAHWDKIPAEVDVLITHGPPYGRGDVVPGSGHQGCRELAAAVVQRRPKLHLYGHIHEGRGVVETPWGLSVNVASSYCSQPPLVIPLNEGP